MFFITVYDVLFSKTNKHINKQKMQQQNHLQLWHLADALIETDWCMVSGGIFFFFFKQLSS